MKRFLAANAVLMFTAPLAFSQSAFAAAKRQACEERSIDDVYKMKDGSFDELHDKIDCLTVKLKAASSMGDNQKSAPLRTTPTTSTEPIDLQITWPTSPSTNNLAGVLEGYIDVTTNRDLQGGERLGLVFANTLSGPFYVAWPKLTYRVHQLFRVETPSIPITGTDAKSLQIWSFVTRDKALMQQQLPVYKDRDTIDSIAMSPNITVFAKTH